MEVFHNIEVDCQMQSNIYLICHFSRIYSVILCNKITTSMFCRILFKLVLHMTMSSFGQFATSAINQIAPGNPFGAYLVYQLQCVSVHIIVIN
jgi:hypothetical protein